MKVLTGLNEVLTTLDGQIVIDAERIGRGVVQKVTLVPDGDCDVLILRANGNIDAVQAPPVRVRGVIANALARAQSPDPVRAMAVALKFHGANRKLELDDADVELARQAVLADQALTNIGKAAALKVFEGIDSQDQPGPAPNRAARREREGSKTNHG